MSGWALAGIIVGSLACGAAVMFVGLMLYIGSGWKW